MHSSGHAGLSTSVGRYRFQPSPGRHTWFYDFAVCVRVWRCWHQQHKNLQTQQHVMYFARLHAHIASRCSYIYLISGVMRHGMVDEVGAGHRWGYREAQGIMSFL